MRAMRVQSRGAINLRGVTYRIASELAGHTVNVENSTRA